MEQFATDSSSNSRSTSIEWPIVLYWLTYLSIVFGILWAFISEAPRTVAGFIGEYTRALGRAMKSVAPVTVNKRLQIGISRQ